MFALRRTVRFSVHHTGSEPAGLPMGSLGVPDLRGAAANHPTPTSPTSHGYSGVPGVIGLGRFEQFDVTCRGPLDPTLNYVVDIKTVDRAVRRTVVPIVAAAFLAEAASGVPADPTQVLARCVQPLAAELAGRLDHIRWHLTPFLSVEISMSPTPAPAKAAGMALLRQKFEFAASHRLHVPTLSADANREAFGKCNHPSGHGHNYIIEPCVEVATDDRGSMSAGLLHRLCTETILDRYDHTYLNVDTPEFDPARGGVVPSVENIAKVLYDRLAPRVASAGFRLVHMTVWESERTAAIYPG